MSAAAGTSYPPTHGGFASGNYGANYTQHSSSAHRGGEGVNDIPIDPALLEEEMGDDAVMVDHALGGVGLPMIGGHDDPADSQMPEPYSYDQPGPSTYASPHVSQLYLEGSRPSRSVSRFSHDPLDSLSPDSASITVSQPRKRGRPSKSSQANGSTPRSSTLKSAPRILLKGMGKGKGKAMPAARAATPSRKGDQADAIQLVQRNTYCDFCQGSDEVNRDGQPERMISCHRCGRSGHPSCLGMKTSRLINAVRSYPWTCIECKTCEVCQVKGEDDKLLFCDGCDRGWHGYCDDPPILKPPKGQYFCPHCRSNRQSSQPASSKDSSVARKSKDRPPSSNTPAPRKKPNGSRASPGYHAEEDDIFDDIRPRIKIKQRKDRMREESDEPASSPAPPLRKIRLRVSSAQQEVEVEEEEEEKVPYGGVIEGADADTSKTKLSDADKTAFEKARKAAEDKMSGGTGNAAPAPSWQPPAASPAPSSHAPNSPLPTKTSGNHGPAHRPSLRDRVLQQSFSGLPDAGPSTPNRSKVIQTASSTQSGLQKIKTIRFGTFDIDTWFSAPYPEEYQNVPDGRLWLCEFCLKYMKSGFVAGRHRMKCKTRHPPGDEIYRDGTISVFEVDGRKNKIYCQNLCLLAKMFLESKTLYYDVEPFLFYVMTEVDDLGARFVGYFSKEKRSMENNVSCIMTLPVRQRKGWGQLLIDFSYLLSKKEGRTGSPERPLSGLGAVTYKKYWRLVVFEYLRSAPEHPRMEDISIATSMTLADVYATLQAEDMIQIHDLPVRETPSKSKSKGRSRGRPPLARRQASPDENADKVELPTSYTVAFDRDYVEAVLRNYQSRGYLTLKPEKLKYHPFLTTRDAEKPPAVQAHAALIASMAQRAHAEETRVDEPATPTLENRNGNNDDVVKGEDPETLALVATLSASPKRNLRKRSTAPDDNDGMPGTPQQRKRPRRDFNATPTDGTRRSTRGAAPFSDEGLDLTPRRPRRGTQPSTSPQAHRTPQQGRAGDTSSAAHGSQGPVRKRSAGGREDAEMVDADDGTGSADASGEDDDEWGEEDAEGEDDEEYV